MSNTMERSLTPISFFEPDIKIKEVISCSRLKDFKLTNLKSIMKKYPGALYTVNNNPKHLVYEFDTNFIEVII